MIAPRSFPPPGARKHARYTPRWIHSPTRVYTGFRLLPCFVGKSDPCTALCHPVSIIIIIIGHDSLSLNSFGTLFVSCLLRTCSSGGSIRDLLATAVLNPAVVDVGHCRGYYRGNLSGSDARGLTAPSMFLWVGVRIIYTARSTCFLWSLRQQQQQQQAVSLWVLVGAKSNNSCLRNRRWKGLKIRKQVRKQGTV